MRADLVALVVATVTSITVLPAVALLVVDASRSWRAAQHFANGRRELALTLLRSAWLRATKAVAMVAMMVSGWVILAGATLPVATEVAVFLWLLALASALNSLDVWWTQRVRRALYRAELRAQDQVRRARRDLR